MQNPQYKLALLSAAGGVTTASETGEDPSTLTPQPSPDTPLQKHNV